MSGRMMRLVKAITISWRRVKSASMHEKPENAAPRRPAAR
jgi:hypothetical protein